MQRRKFIRQVSLGALATGFLPGMTSVIGQTSGADLSLVTLSQAATQIRHGALNLPVNKQDMALPFDWLLQVQRNIFLQNGFQRNEPEDLEIVSLLLKNESEVEAVQIQLRPESTSVLAGENYQTFARETGIQMLSGNFPNPIGLAHFKASKKYEVPVAEGGQVFVHLLSGGLRCNGLSLDTDTGLAVENGGLLKFECLVDSQVIMVYSVKDQSSSL